MPGSLEGIRREHIEAFLVALQDAGSRPATVSLAYRCLQAFWKWAVSEDEVMLPDTGMRRGEITCPRLADIDLELDGPHSLRRTARFG